MDTKSKFIIKRDNEMVLFYVAFDIIIDGNKLGQIGSGKEKIISIDPGNHKVVIECDTFHYGKLNSFTEQFSVEGNSEIEFKCGTNYKGIDMLLSDFGLMKNRSSSIYIKQV